MPIGINRAARISQISDSGGSAIPDSVVSRPNDDSTLSTSGQCGFEITTKSEWRSIGARISDNSSAFTTAYLQDSGGTTIQSVDVSGLVAGDTFTFENVYLGANTSYLIVLDAGGSSWTLGFNNLMTGYPYESSDVDITAGVFESSVGTGRDVQGLNDIGNTGFN